MKWRIFWKKIDDFWWIGNEKARELAKKFREEDKEIRIDENDPYGEEFWENDSPVGREKRINLVKDLFRQKLLIVMLM